RFVQYGGLRVKQGSFPDTAEAKRVEALLRETDELQRFPHPILRLENTVWVNFLPGRKPDPERASDVAAVADFFIDIYRDRPIERTLEETGLHRRLQDNLKLLGDVGLVDGHRLSAVRSLAERLRPDRLWIGLDYIDALAKNFIVSDGRVVGIDIEAIQEETLLGAGLAKAGYRWLGDQVDPIIERLADGDGPDLRAQWPYTQLSFLAGYDVQNLMRGKAARIRAEDFDALLSRFADATDGAPGY
ncbi:MAG: hypothetical protein V2J10_12050, partial [Wenzhouxiangella sp.]|nr:hypothetical protein [Wenzhouxiangella sp.]